MALLKVTYDKLASYRFMPKSPAMFHIAPLLHYDTVVLRQCQGWSNGSHFKLKLLDFFELAQQSTAGNTQICGCARAVTFMFGQRFVDQRGLKFAEM